MPNFKSSDGYQMKNSTLRKGSMHKTPMQMNYGSPAKDYSVTKGSHAHKIGSPMEHEPWATKHRQKSAHSATAEAHGKQPKNTGNKPFTDGKDGAASRPENQ